MYNYAPKNYNCPICLGIKGIENSDSYLKKSDLVYRDKFISVFVNSFFIGNNPGHVIVVPNDHYENLFDMPKKILHKLFEISQKIAVAMKAAYKCKGITLLQNNEPSGGQHAFHFHLHIFPRYKDDQLHSFMDKKRLTTPKERLPYAEKLKQFLK